MTNRFLIGAAFTVAGAILSMPVNAADKTPCPVDMACASKPGTIVDLVKATDPAATVTTSDGATRIVVKGHVFTYTIYFRDCDAGASCAALTFQSDFSVEKAADIAFANKWNRDFRIPKAFIGEDGGLVLQMEVSTLGGITKANFRDWKSWYESNLGEFAKFFKKESGG